MSSKKFCELRWTMETEKKVLFFFVLSNAWNRYFNLSERECVVVVVFGWIAKVARVYEHNGQKSRRHFTFRRFKCCSKTESCENSYSFIYYAIYIPMLSATLDNTQISIRMYTYASAHTRCVCIHFGTRWVYVHICKEYRMRAIENENFSLFYIFIHTSTKHETAWYRERTREHALIFVLHVYIYIIFIYNYTYMIWFSVCCVCMVNQQHYRRRVCDSLCVCVVCFFSSLLFYFVTTVCLREFAAWHTCFHTFAAFFKLSFILWPVFIVVVARFICRIWSFIWPPYTIAQMCV